VTGVQTCALPISAAGYALGEHQDLLERYLHLLTFFSIAAAMVLAVGYLLWHRRFSRDKKR
jgi:membrane protein DedA with SNARE-associated domain